MIIQKFNLYEENENVFYTTYLIEDNQEKGVNKKKRPLALICPGGAYMRISERETEPVALSFVNNDFHAITLNYTVASCGDATYPNSLLDLANLLVLVHKKADDWLIDVNHITLVGFSAGAHLCASLATHWHEKWLSDKAEAEPGILKVESMVLGYPVVDYTYQGEMLKNDPTANIVPEGQRFSKAQFMKMANSVLAGNNVSEERFIEISPVYNVTNNTPPTFIWATSEDDLVYPGNSLRYALELEKEKVPFEIHIFQKGKHGLSLANRRTAKTSEDIDPEVAEWFNMALNFIERNRN